MIEGIGTMAQRDGNHIRPITWSVMEPRDRPCRAVNPRLWAEYCRVLGSEPPVDQLHTEAYCVQWLDQRLPAGQEETA
jgi:hypothetical protein